MTLTLLPYPKTMTLTGSAFTLPDTGSIILNVPRPADLFFTAQRAEAAIRTITATDWQIAGGRLPGALVITFDGSLNRPQGYRLTIDAEGIRIAASDAPGAFYGVMTLAQIIQTAGRTLPGLTIEDWPDFPARGVLLDISRDKVPSMQTLYDLIDLLAGWKINQVQLYTEHTFAYRDHRAVWQHASPVTAGQILSFDACCRERFIELVPNQSSFGHMHRWFEHARYMPLAEIEGEFETPWGSIWGPFSLSPAVPETVPFLAGLYDELLPNFTSRLFNVNGDETFDLGLGRSKTLVEQRGKGRVYLDFLLKIYDLVRARGHTMQFWGDIINQYPDLVPDVPKDTIALEWGYEADHDFPGKTKLFADSGVPFYVCPGTSSWTSIAGRTDNCTANIRNAVKNGLKHGAVGVLNTDWGDQGHWQPLPVSYLGFACGAALSWAYAQNVTIDLATALAAFAFRDQAGVMGKLAYDLGNAYQVPGVLVPNSSALFLAYSVSLDAMRSSLFANRLSPEAQAVLADDARLTANLRATLDYIDGALQPLSRAEMARPDADLVTREFALAGWMLRHGAQRALFQLGGEDFSAGSLAADLDAIETEFRALWLARNRPGGLDDSIARLHAAHDLYKTP